MALTTAADRRYLYVQHSNDEGITLFDVTNPTRPKLLGTTFWLEGEKVGDLTLLGDYAVGTMLPVDDGSPETDLALRARLFIGAPSQTRFKHLKRAIFDEGFVYVLTDTGVWIIAASSLP